MLKQTIRRRISLAGIRRSVYFDEEYYRNAAGIPPSVDAAAHYYDGGWRNADPSARFSNDEYREENRDVAAADICPLAHYLVYGKLERRLISPNAVNHYHRYALWRSVKRNACELWFHRTIRKNRTARILVILHVYYEDACEELIEYLKNLRKYQYDLIVTTSEGRDAGRIEAAFRAFRNGTEVIVCPNKGFDIAPYLAAIRRIDPGRYDVVVKVHSKRHFRREGAVAASMFVRGRDWFLFLIEAVLSARRVHKNIDRLIHEPGTVLIAAENLIQKDPPHKQRMTAFKLKEVGLELPADYTFVAGTCFAIRADAVRKYHCLPLDADSFEASERNYFSLAHAMERYLAGVIPASSQKGNRVCRMRLAYDRVFGRKRLGLRGQRIPEETDLQLDDDFLLRFLENTLVYGYEVTDVPVNSLFVLRGEERIPLNRCVPYLYLEDMKGNEQMYREYCLSFRKTDYMVLSQREFEQEVSRNGIERYRRLIRALDQEGYDERRPVVIRRGGEILDGQHRACWYMHRFGEDSRIRVLSIQTDPPGQTAGQDIPE